MHLIRRSRPNARRVITLLCILLAALLPLAIPAVRLGLLRATGHMLTQQDASERVDVIVIAGDADDAGVLEAADLVQRGFAGRIAIFVHRPSAAAIELARRGVRAVDPAAWSTHQLRELGVTAPIEQIPGFVSGTTDEGRLLRQWCRDRQVRTVLLVSAADHATRTRRVLRRWFQGTDTRAIVRAARYSEFDPDSWWQSRSGRRTQLVETEKLLLDVLSHPLS